MGFLLLASLDLCDLEQIITPAEKNSLELEKMQRHPLWFYIFKNKRNFFVGLTFLFFTNLLDGVYPILLKEGIDHITKKSPVEDLHLATYKLFAVLLGLAITRFFWRYFFGQYHLYSAEDLRRKIFSFYIKLAPSFFQKNPIGELMSTITNDVQSFRQGIGPGVLILFDGFSLLGILLPLMFYLNVEWTLKCLIFFPLVPYLISKITKWIFDNYKIEQDYVSELSGIAQESVGGIRVIKSFVQENRRMEIYNKKSLQLEKQRVRTNTGDALFVPIMQIGVTAGTVILLFIGSADVLSGAATLGTLVAFQRYIAKISWPMTALGLGFSQLQKGWASFDRIKSIFAQKNEILPEGNITLEKIESLEFVNVSFSYPSSSELTLKNLSFKITAGERIGLIGPVGSGKSTLVQLIARIYDATAGDILINGLSIKNYTRDSLYKCMTIIPQEPFLFSQSISENILYGVVNENEIENFSAKISPTLKAVQLENEIQSLPNQSHSQLGERGVNLSGGQKQRLTIARGLILNSSFLILDDVLSAVDTQTEHAIKNEMKNKKGTSLIVTHRLTSIEDADRVLILNNGELEAFAPIAQLKKTSVTYKRIEALQNTIATSVETT